MGRPLRPVRRRLSRRPPGSLSLRARLAELALKLREPRLDINPATRQFLLDNLTADGYEVLSAEDRTKAIAILDIYRPELIVVDVNGDTLALLDAVRSADGIAGRLDPDTPMIVLTGDADTLQRVRVLERDGDDVVAKPFSYPELRTR